MSTTQARTSALQLMKKDVVDVVENKVQQLIHRGELQLPANYSAPNAMKAAWLKLQSTVDRNKNLVLESCTKDSIANTLLSMVVQGLNPDKNQCYFIAYNNKLTLSRSYFGTMAVAKMVDDRIDEIIYEVVYEGDTFKYKLDRGKKIVTEHEQTLENIKPDKIKAAYCAVYAHDGSVLNSEIMPFEQIKQSWKQSQINPVDAKGNIKADTTHAKFTADMALRTVISKCCKPIINASDDSGILKQYLNASDDIRVEAEVAEEIAENANGEVIDVTFAEVDGQTVDESTGEVIGGSGSSASDEAKKEEQPVSETENAEPTEAEWEEIKAQQQAAEAEGPGF